MISFVAVDIELAHASGHRAVHFCCGRDNPNLSESNASQQSKTQSKTKSAAKSGTNQGQSRRKVKLGPEVRDLFSTAHGD